MEREIDPKVLENLSDRIKEWYELIQSIFDTYMDMEKTDKKILGLWSIAANFKDSFHTFPFIFLNASKGSGKTRLLKILENVINHAKATPNLTEASLIRLPSQQKLNCLLIDEAERMNFREKATLRELLNQAYKKGGVVLRVEEGKEKTRVVKEFPVFLGICIANIWGLESVLEDRCLTIILKKSNVPNITKIPEMFQFDERFGLTRSISLVYSVYVESLISMVSEYLFKALLYYYHTLSSYSTLHTHTTYTTLIDQPLLKKEFLTMPTNVDIIFEHIKKSTLVGRDLELWLPLIITSALISEKFMIEVIEIAENKCLEKHEFEIMEDRDTIFASFLGYYVKANGCEMMIPVKDMKINFEKIEGEKYWLSTQWIGRCLRRIGIIKNKRRIAKGVEIEINDKKLNDFLDKRGVSIDEKRIDEYKEELQKESPQKTFKKFTGVKR